MRFNEIITDRISTLTSISQESLLSSILYILYNNNLLDISKRKEQLKLEYIDDILYDIQNKTTLRNIKELKQLFIKFKQ